MSFIKILLLGASLATKEAKKPTYTKVSLYNKFLLKEEIPGEKKPLEISEQAVVVFFEDKEEILITEVFLLEVPKLKKGEQYQRKSPASPNSSENPYSLIKISLKESSFKKLSSSDGSITEKNTYITYTVDSNKKTKKEDEEEKKDEEKNGLYIVIHKESFISKGKPVAYQVCFITKKGEEQTVHHSNDIFVTETEEEIPKIKKKDVMVKERQTTKILVAKQIEYSQFRYFYNFSELPGFKFALISFTICILAFTYFFIKT
ncbi:hypothetical protein CDIK_1386 [Cucumispora dikerogammari]|nr:hypothetical protein CDIK_1386 [Cucumispora dikerogammari]